MNKKSTITDLRQAAWHLRTGGVKQLRRWYRRRQADTPISQKKLKAPLPITFKDNKTLLNSWLEFRDKNSSLPDRQRSPILSPFPHGWLLTNDTSVIAFTDTKNWIGTRFGGWYLSHDPRLDVVNLESSDKKTGVLIFGQMADSKIGAKSSEELGPILLKTLSDSTDWSAFDQLATWLGGRFVLIGRKAEETRVHVDAMASRSCFWAEKNLSVTLGSHSALVANAIGETAAEQAKWVLSHSDYQNPAGKCLPGTIAPHDSVNLTFANCALLITNNEVTHSRFFSTPPTDMSVEEASTIFIEELRFQMAAALELRPKTVFGLTAGSDSRAILAATLDQLKAANVSAMTYHFFTRNADHSLTDLLGANALAEKSGLCHRIIDVSHRSEKTPFNKIYQQTFPTWARFPSLARAYHEDLGPDVGLILGIGGEIGTVFYQDRDFNQITPEVLSSKFTQSEFKNNPQLIQTMADYMDFTQLDNEHSSGYDILDLFYWEHRMSSWASYGYSEADFGPLVILPLNSRRIFHCMLSLPFEQRLRKSIYQQLKVWSGI